MAAVVPVFVLVALSQAGQAQQNEVTQDPAVRAAVAAERAAQAAERSAVAAESVARRVEQWAGEAPPAEGAKAAEAAGNPDDTWSGSAGLGLIWMGGNADALTFSGNAAASRTTPDWVWGLRANAMYGQSRPAGTPTSQVVARGGSLMLRGDRRFTQSVSGYLLVGAEADHVRSVEARGLLEAGSGVIWARRTRGEFVQTLVRTDFAVRYAREGRYQYFPVPRELPDITLVAPKLGLNVRYAVSEGVVFTEEGEVLLNVAGQSRVLVNSMTKVSTRMSDRLSFTVAFLLTHDSTPALGKLPTDTSLTVGLEATF